MKQAILAVACVLSLLSSCSSAAHPRHGGVRSGAYTLELVDESGRVLRTFNHNGRTYVLGAAGQRYLMRIHNHSGRRIEVVASVDGRDVVDGQPAAVTKRGYLVDAHGQMTIDGFRTSLDKVAAFRFSKVAKSYAALMGDARDVGVIGVAVFSERYVPPPAPPPYYSEGYGGRAPSAPSADSMGAPEQEAPRAQSRAEKRSGLGTQFGEEHTSHVTHVEFVRASSQPETVMSLRYNDRRGLMALGIDVDGPRVSQNELWMRETAEPFRAYAQPPPGWNR